MESLFYVLVGMIFLFGAFLVGKSLIKKKEFCVICALVSFSWLVLLFFYWEGIFEDMLVIAILMGQSSIGFYYFLESRIDERFKVFRLPFILSLVFVIYSVVSLGFGFNSFVLILVLWVLFGFLYFYRNYSGVSVVVNKLVECCKKW